MNLQGDHAAGGRLVRLLVDHFGGQRLVDEVLQMVAIGDDSKIIPLPWVDPGGKCLGIAETRCGLLALRVDCDFLATLGKDAASPFLLQTASELVGEVNIGLVSADHELAFVNDLAAILYPRVSTFDFELSGQLKVIWLAALPDKKGVAIDGVFIGSTSDNLTVLG